MAALAMDSESLPRAADSAAPYYRRATPAFASALRIEGARENNLKNLSLSIPHRQLSVVTGVSGSGKSTLAFDIVFAEGQRRFMESMSPYARQFVEQLPRPDVDQLTGIPPTVAIEQRVTRGSRKSTVATITEVAQYLRLLYARLGVQHHPDTDKPVTPLSPGSLKNLLNRVPATCSPRMTSSQPPQSQPDSANHPVLLNRLNRIFRTGRMKSATRPPTSQKSSPKGRQPLLKTN
jgi:excinuclease ABC subunit A